MIQINLILANDTIMIGKNAFKDSSLSEIVILEDSYLREIHSYAFANSKIKKIFIPTSVEFIGENVFDDLIGLDIYTSHSVEDMSIFHNIKNPNATIHYNYRYLDYEQLK